MIPLYGFVEGDTMGLLLLADEEESVAALAARLQSSAAPRLAPAGKPRLIWQGRPVDPRALVANVGFAPLDRIDLVVTREVRA